MINRRTNAAHARLDAMAGISLRQREREAEEAGWELQIRRMTTHGISQPSVAATRASVTQSLDLVRDVGRHDMLLLPRTLPMGEGGEAENLACGSCAATIVAGLGRAAARRRHPEGDRVIVRCTCKALNLLYGLAQVRARHHAGPDASPA